jgi:hypothetical protein
VGVEAEFQIEQRAVERDHHVRELAHAIHAVVQVVEGPARALQAFHRGIVVHCHDQVIAEL